MGMKTVEREEQVPFLGAEGFSVPLASSIISKSHYAYTSGPGNRTPENSFLSRSTYTRIHLQETTLRDEITAQEYKQTRKPLPVQLAKQGD